MTECAAREPLDLTRRQELVLRSVVGAYVGEAVPVGSHMVASVLPVSLSSASIRSTMAELEELGLIEKPHPSAGRMPTERGFRVFVDRLLGPCPLGAYERRDLAGTVDDLEPEVIFHVASQILSERTRQLGFVLAPRLERVLLRRVALIRLSARRVLAVLVAEDGSAHRRVLEDEESGSQAELERVAVALNERVGGRTLVEVRESLAREVRALRSRADRVVERAVWLGLRALESEGRDPNDLVIATRLALLDQPEFHNPERVRRLFAALDAHETLVRILDRMLAAPGVRVAIGDELDELEVRDLAVVAAPYGVAGSRLGVLGVIGPSRMDYGRVIALVDYLSQLVTEKLYA